MKESLTELAAVAETLPPQYATKVTPLVAKLIEASERRTRILSLVQDALSQLRLDMKYIAFDLEATRRERDGYKARLDAE